MCSKDSKGLMLHSCCFGFVYKFYQEGSEGGEGEQPCGWGEGEEGTMEGKSGPASVLPCMRHADALKI